jgi:hypothetical protein
MSRCAQGLYCSYPDLPEDDSDYGEGTCEPRGTAGQPCDWRFESADCIGSCDLVNDQFLCNAASILPETLFCDGE